MGFILLKRGFRSWVVLSSFYIFFQMVTWFNWINLRLFDGPFYEKSFILIGASVTKDKIHKKHTVASVVCTMNQNASSFYNESVYQEDGSDLIHSIKEIIKQCCIKYYRINNVKPARIIYLRDGINPSGYNSFNMIEL